MTEKIGLLKMLGSNILEIPFDESKLMSKTARNEDFKSTPKRKILCPPQKKLLLQCEDNSSEKYLILSNNDILNSEVYSEKGVQEAVFKKIKRSTENYTVKENGLLQLAVEETPHSEENSESVEVLQNVEHKTIPQMRKRYFTRCSTRKIGVPEKDHVLIQNKKHLVGYRIKRKYTRRNIKNNAFEKKETMKEINNNLNLTKGESIETNLFNENYMNREIVVEVKKKPGRRGRKKKVIINNIDDQLKETNLFKEIDKNEILPEAKKKPGRRGRKKGVRYPKKKQILGIKRLVKQQVRIDKVSKNNEKDSSSIASSSIKRLKKSQMNFTDPKFHEPFKYGWRREVVFRTYPKISRADVYYYTPFGEKLRSFVDIQKKIGNTELTLDNFTFYKGSVGINDSNKEIVRNSKSLTVNQQIKRQLLQIFHENNTASSQENNLYPSKTLISNCDYLDNLNNLSESSIRDLKDTDKTDEFDNINRSVSPEHYVYEINPSTISQDNFDEVTETNTDVSNTSDKINLSDTLNENNDLNNTEHTNISAMNLNLIKTIECFTENFIDLQNENVIFINETEIKSISDNSNFNPNEDVSSSTATIIINDKTIFPESNVNKITELNNLHNNFPGTTAIVDDSTQIIESFSDVLNVQNSSTYPGAVTTTTDTSESNFFTKSTNQNLGDFNNTAVINEFGETIGFGNHKLYDENSLSLQDTSTIIKKCDENIYAIKTNSVNIKTLLNKNILLESDSYEINDFSNSPNLMKGSLKEIKSVACNKIEKENDVSGQDIFPSSIEDNIFHDNLSKKYVNNIERIQNDSLDDNFSSFKNINNNLESKIGINNSYKNIDQQMSQINFRLNSQTSVQHIHIYQPFVLLENILNNKKTGNQSFKTNSLVITPTKQNNLLKLNYSPKRIKVNTQQTSVHPHSIASFCAGYTALKLIFSYLNVEDLLIARRVCSVWKELADQPILWKKVGLNNSQMTDHLATVLLKRGTEHLLVLKEDDSNWENFLNAVTKIKSLQKLDLCSCTADVFETIIKTCPQLKIINALSINSQTLNLEHIGNLENLKQLHLKATNNMSIENDLTNLANLVNLTDLSLKHINNLNRANIQAIQFLSNLNNLELGECSGFDTFGSSVLPKLKNLKRLRLEKIQDSESCIDILINVSKLKNLTDLELVNFNMMNGFDKYLPMCQNITKLVLIPNYEHQAGLLNNIILNITTELMSNLKHFIWGIPEEFIQFSMILFEKSEDVWIPFLKPIPHFQLIKEIINTGERNFYRKQLEMITKVLINVLENQENSFLNTPKVDMLSVSGLQKLYAILLPKTKLDIIKIETML